MLDYEELLERIDGVFSRLSSPSSNLTARERDLLYLAAEKHPNQRQLNYLILLCYGE